MEAAARLANRLLDREAWARERLAAHGGRTIRITVGPVASSFRITESGLLDGEPVAAADCDLSLFVSPLSLNALRYSALASSGESVPKIALCSSNLCVVGFCWSTTYTMVESGFGPM